MVVFDCVWVAGCWYCRGLLVGVNGAGVLMPALARSGGGVNGGGIVTPALARSDGVNDEGIVRPALARSGGVNGSGVLMSALRVAGWSKRWRYCEACAGA